MAHNTLPQPVNVTNWPPPDVTSLHWAEAGVIFAAVAALAALITLACVAWQIALAKDALKLAKHELKATNDTLGLAKTELDLATQGLDETRRSNEMVKESLEYTRSQAKEFSKRARLEAFTLNPIVGNYPRNQTLYSQFFIVNRGDRGATNAVFRLLMPPGVGFGPAYQFKKEWRILPNWNDGTHVYEVLERDIQQPLPPKCVVQFTVMELMLVGDWKVEPLYQLMYDDGVTPTTGAATKLLSRDEVDPNGLLVGLPPK